MDKFQLKIAEELFYTLTTPKEKETLIRKVYEECAAKPWNGPPFTSAQATLLKQLVQLAPEVKLPDYILATIYH